MAATDRAGGRAGWLDGLAGVIIFRVSLPATRVAMAEIDPLFLTFAQAVPSSGQRLRAAWPLSFAWPQQSDLLDGHGPAWPNMARHSPAERMTKSELIADLAQDNPHLLGRDVELIVATIFDQITAALAGGSRVELRGFGAFTVKRRDARIGRNPRTGATVDVSEKAVPFFKAGKELRERVNRGPKPVPRATGTLRVVA